MLRHNEPLASEAVPPLLWSGVLGWSVTGVPVAVRPSRPAYLPEPRRGKKIRGRLTCAPCIWSYQASRPLIRFSCCSRNPRAVTLRGFQGCFDFFEVGEVVGVFFYFGVDYFAFFVDDEGGAFADAFEAH